MRVPIVKSAAKVVIIADTTGLRSAILEYISYCENIKKAGRLRVRLLWLLAE
jgi:hypothetical protein